MKKIILCGVCVVFCGFAAMPVLAEDTVKITVNEEKKAEVEAKINGYQQQAKTTIAKAEEEIKKAQANFDKVKADTQKTINTNLEQIKKLQEKSKAAKENFDKVRTETNTKIEAANAQIKKANEDLKNNITAVQKFAE